MGGHIRMDKDLEDDPRVLKLADAFLESWAEQLGLPTPAAEHLRGAACNAALGALFRLWRLGDTHLRRHDRLDIALPRLARLLGCNASLLSQFPGDWLRIHPDGSIELPGYAAKNALIDKDQRREKTRERVRRWRERKRAGVTASPGVTSEALQRHQSVTTGTGTGTGPGTGPSGTGTGGESAPAQAEPAGSLARATGRLASRGSEVQQEKSPPAALTAAELEQKARKLSAAGFGVFDIARQLAQFGADVATVTTWLANGARST